MVAEDCGGQPSGAARDAGSRLVVALDYPDAESARRMARQLDPARCRVKVGKELFTAAGPALVQELVGDGFDVFLDLKFHDIPNTVAGAVRAAAELGVWMVNVHASGGGAMMRAAADALQAFGDRRPLLIAVTVLTSLGEEDLAELGINEPLEAHVLRLAALARESGLDGFVCSAREVPLIRSRFGPGPVLVTPGIRPRGAGGHDDQRRTLGPREALEAGSDYLVIGRPITASADPAQSLATILSEMSYSVAG